MTAIVRRLLAALLVGLPTAAAADDLAVRFAARPIATSVALSPLGDRLAYVGAYRTGGKAVFVADLKTGESEAIIAGAALSLTPQRCDFKTETRLICKMYGILDTGVSFTRLLAVDVDGRNRILVGAQLRGGRYGGGIVDWLPDDPDHVLVALDGVDRVDVRTGKATNIEHGADRTAAFGANRGEVRFRALVDHDDNGYLKNTSQYLIRAPGSRAWKPLIKIALNDQRGPDFNGFDEAGDHVFLLAPLDGRQALFSVPTDGSNVRTLVFAHPEVDVEDVARIGKYQRPIAATFTTDRQQLHYFDPQLGALAASLTKALPGHPDVSIVDESWDGTKKLVYVDSDARPGRYFLYDTGARKLGALLSTYPDLDGVPLGTVTPIRFAARDGTMIPGYLTLPPGRTDARGLPGIVMPHGGPAARDTAGFDWLAQFFAAEGFAVLQPNFRGSTGYGDAFFADDGFRSWPLAIGDVNDGGRWLVTQGVPAGRLAIFGWSYGGYAALQANVVDPALFRATVAVAPVTDLELMRTSAAGYTNYKQIGAMVGTGELVRSGSPARNVTRFAAPVLIFHADKDQNVDIAQSRIMVAALKKAGKKVEFVEYKNLDHQIDDTVARTDMLTKSAAFLKAATN